ncbi:hypothetical protein FA15DRAFT_422016 [Coprinopsis marcescibilis]|uniref:Uncharacterized protein n=1 Tax=Coprinopsis marcescibilis TaxID=230819 RepID=A0A5C3KUH0_COPMA|nr:hypothetical protein FA15DRAFT_422016 [Coprinopsis marcescibilis]
MTLCSQTDALKRHHTSVHKDVLDGTTSGTENAPTTISKRRASRDSKSASKQQEMAAAMTAQPVTQANRGKYYRQHTEDNSPPRSTPFARSKTPTWPQPSISNPNYTPSPYYRKSAMMAKIDRPFQTPLPHRFSSVSGERSSHSSSTSSSSSARSESMPLPSPIAITGERSTTPTIISHTISFPLMGEDTDDLIVTGHELDIALQAVIKYAAVAEAFRVAPDEPHDMLIDSSRSSCLNLSSHFVRDGDNSDDRESSLPMEDLVHDYDSNFDEDRQDEYNDNRKLQYGGQNTDWRTVVAASRGHIHDSGDAFDPTEMFIL